MCSHLEVSNYYESLPDTITDSADEQMRLRICESHSTYKSRYYDITECKYNSALYNEFLNERKRIIISRWWLSSYQLKIETGRYTTPKTPRDDRTCSVCPTKIEDECLVIFDCPLYHVVRTRYNNLISKYASINKILNPGNIKDAEEHHYLWLLIDV